MSHTVDAKQLVKEMKSFGKLPKQFTVKVKRDEARFPGHTSNYALVQVVDDQAAAIVPYEVLRKLMERLQNERVEMSVRADGVRIQYGHGAVFLKHIEGEWKNVKRLAVTSA